MKHAKWILAIMMALLMVVTTVMPVFAIGEEEPTAPGASYQKIPGEELKNRLKLKGVESSRFDTLETDPETVVTAIVIFGEDGANALEEDQNTTKAISARKKMASEQNAFVAKLNNKFDAKLLYNYTVLANGVSVETKLVNLAEIEQMEGVKAVYIANEYGVPKTETPEATTSAMLSGATQLMDWGYAGQGTIVAVLDTGLKTDHEAFQDYGITEDVLTEEGIAEIETLKAGKYLSAKVPFSYDYADNDNDVTDANGHGTHVAGIATGYVEDADGAITFHGAAPRAQLAFMKIFKSAASTTNSGIYFAALEDAFLIGADVVNMSIGADSGFIHDFELEDELFGNIYKKLDDAGVLVCTSAGNDTNMAMGSISLAALNGYEYPNSSYQDYGVVGTPSTYGGNTSVASMENVGYPAYMIMVGDRNITFNDTCNDSVNWFDYFAGETFEYVDAGLGSVEECEAADLEGKIALIIRGVLNFEEKVENAANAGAVGVIVRNNQPGIIGMSIETFEVPAVSIQQEDGEFMMEAMVDGVGTMSVSEEPVFVDNAAALEISDFSSWGVTPSLTLKPQITGIGGMVYSASITGTDRYEVMSGTSMAAPNVTGSFASLISYLHETYPNKDKYEISKLAENLAGSTAWSADSSTSPRQQGAGLIDVVAAINTPIVVSEPIVEIGDDPERTGIFKISFDVENLSNLDVAYGISPEIMAPGALSGFYSMWDALKDVEITADCQWRSDWDGDVVTMKPFEKVNVTVTVVVHPELVALLSEIFPNGNFIEGYVNLYPLDASIDFFEVSFPSVGEVIWVAYGDTINEAAEVIPEVPMMYGSRGGHWDADFNAPVYSDMVVNPIYDWILYGDATCADEVDAADAAAVLRHVVRIEQLTEEGLENAIVTPDYNELTAADAAAILRKVVRLIEKFPIEIRNEQLNAQMMLKETVTLPDEAIESIAPVHATFAGFLGDWTEAPALEAYDFRDVTEILKYCAYTGIASEGYTWYYFQGFGEQTIGYNEAYAYDPFEGLIDYLGGNPFAYTDKDGNFLEYDEDRIAISDWLELFFSGDNCYTTGFMSYPTQLRNLRHLIMTVTDAETNEEYYRDDTEYLRKAVYNPTTGVYDQQGSFSWEGTDANGYSVPDGTVVNVEYWTQLDYEGAELKKEWEYQVLVDKQVPVFDNVEFDPITRILSFDVTDNHYLAVIEIQAGNEVIYSDGYADDERGATTHIELDLKDNLVEELAIVVADYATNMTGITIETPLPKTITIGALRNRNNLENPVVRGVIHHIDEENVYVQSPNDEVAEGDMPWGLTIGDAINNTGNEELQVGDVCYILVPTSSAIQLSPIDAYAPAAMFLFVVDHIDSEDILATQIMSVEQITERLMATRVEIPSAVPTDKANIILTVQGDVWGDGSGYQLLMDADATAYGDLFQEAGPLTTDGGAAQAIYDEFEHKIPTNADGDLDTTNIVNDDSVSIEVLAGVYDFCIANPVPDERIWIAGGTSRADDYEFLPGLNYEFIVSYDAAAGSDNVRLVVTDMDGNVASPAHGVPMPKLRTVTAELLNETFADLSAWTQIDADGDGNVWEHRYAADQTGHAPENDGCATSASYLNDPSGYGGAAVTPDNWLISQQVDLTAVTDPYVGLNFWVQAQDEDWAGEVFGVYVSKAGNTDTADFEEVYSAKMSATGPILRATDWFNVEVDLSAYIGEEIYVAFRHFDCTDEFMLNIDDAVLYTATEAPSPVDPDPDPDDPVVPADILLSWTAASLDGWTLIDADGDGNVWEHMLTSVETGHGPENDGNVTSASFINDVGPLTPDNWLISKQIDLTAVTKPYVGLSFWVQAQDAAWPGEVFGVYVSKAGNTDTADFEEVYSAKMSATGPIERDTTAWFEVEVDLSAYIGEEIYIAFRHYDCTDNFYLNIDDVLVYTGANGGGDTPVDPELPEDTVFAWTAASLDGWTLVDADGDSNEWYLLGPNDGETGFPGHGPENDGLASSASYAGGALRPDNWLITPRIDLSAEGRAKLSFWVQAQDESWPGEVFGVYVSTKASIDIDDFVNVYDATMTSDGPELRATTDWFKVEIDLSAYVGQQIYIAFRHYDCYDQFRLNLDDVYVTGGESNFGVNMPTMPFGFEIVDIGGTKEPYAITLSDGVGTLLVEHNDTPLFWDEELEAMRTATNDEFIVTSMMAGLFTVVQTEEMVILHSNDEETLITKVGSGSPVHQGVYTMAY